MAEEDAPRRKGRDPILMIGSIVLALAFVIVISGYVYGQFTSEEKGPAKYGDAVKVDYVGSYYGWYDGYGGTTGAVIFDTSLWSVAGNDSYDFSWSFKKTESGCVPISTTIGSNSLLSAFEGALIGMKPGDTVHVKIDAKDGYGELKDENKKSWSLEETDKMSLIEYMSAETFKATFGTDVVNTGPQPAVKHPYGWMCDAVYDSYGVVTVTHHPETGEDLGGGEYKHVMNDNIDVITSPGSAGKFNIKFEFHDLEYYVEEGVSKLKPIEFKESGQTYYVIDVDATTFTTKNTAETVGMTLYFVITFVGYQ